MREVVQTLRVGFRAIQNWAEVGRSSRVVIEGVPFCWRWALCLSFKGYSRD
jgi:hypothetical protein